MPRVWRSIVGPPSSDCVLANTQSHADISRRDTCGRTPTWNTRMGFSSSIALTATKKSGVLVQSSTTPRFRLMQPLIALNVLHACYLTQASPATTRVSNPGASSALPSQRSRTDFLTPLLSSCPWIRRISGIYPRRHSCRPYKMSRSYSRTMTKTTMIALPSPTLTSVNGISSSAVGRSFACSTAPTDPSRFVSVRSPLSRTHASCSRTRGAMPRMSSYRSGRRSSLQQGHGIYPSRPSSLVRYLQSRVSLCRLTVLR